MFIGMTASQIMSYNYAVGSRNPGEGTKRHLRMQVPFSNDVFWKMMIFIIYGIDNIANVIYSIL